MKKIMVAFVAVLALGLLLNGCKRKLSEKLESELEKAVTEAVEEETAKEEAGEEGEEEGKEEAKEEEGGGGGGCDAYAKCIEDYATALSKVKGVPAASVDAIKSSSSQIENLKKAPGGDKACNDALDAMKKGMDAYKAMPGFEAPASCK